MSRPPPDPTYILRGLGASVTALDFSNVTGSQQKLLSGDSTGLINIWNLSTKRSETTLNGHNNTSILKVQYLSDDKILSHGRDGRVQIWCLQEGRSKITDTLEVSDVGFCKCEILNYKNKDEFYIIASGQDQSQIDVIDLKNKQVFKKFIPDCKKSLGMCMCLKIVRVQDGMDVILAGYENGSLLAWDLQTSNIIDELKVHSEPVMCLDFDSSSLRGVTGSADNMFAVFRLTQQGKLTAEKTVEIKNPGLSAVKIRGDSKILATGGWDSKVRIFSWKSSKPLAILNYHTQSVDALAFSEFSDKLLGVGSKDGRISLWSLYKDN